MYLTSGGALLDAAHQGESLVNRPTGRWWIRRHRNWDVASSLDVIFPSIHRHNADLHVGLRLLLRLR